MDICKFVIDHENWVRVTHDPLFSLFGFYVDTKIAGTPCTQRFFSQREAQEHYDYWVAQLAASIIAPDIIDSTPVTRE